MAKFVKWDEDSAKVGFPPPLVYLGMLLLGLLADSLFGFGLPIEQGLRFGGGVALVIIGLMVVLSAAKGFDRAGTDLKPWKTSSAIVSDGIYQLTRNPMYLGMAFMYLGISLGFASPSALVLFPVLILVIQTQVIAREEAYLEAKFGDAYRTYRARVRRWL